MTTTRKLTIAAVALLVCGVVVALVWKPAPAITLTLLKVETNQLGVVEGGITVTVGSGHETNDTSRAALIFVKSSTPRETYIRFGAQPAPFDALRDLYEVGGSVRMLAPTGALVRVTLPTPKPCVVFFGMERRYPSSWLGRAQSRCDRYLLKRKPYDVFTLDIP